MVSLRGLRVFAHHGVLPHETEHGQVFVIDLDLGIDLAPVQALAGRDGAYNATLVRALLAG